MAQEVPKKGDAQVALDAMLLPQPEDMLQLLPVIPPQLHAAQRLPALAQAGCVSKGNLQWCAGCVLESHLHPKRNCDDQLPIGKIPPLMYRSSTGPTRCPTSAASIGSS